LALRYGWPAYAVVERAMTFNLSMKIARLSLSAVASVAAALTLWRIKPSLIAELVFGLIMLGAFIPVHIGLWPKFAIWYHLTFLSSLVILPLLFALLAQPRSAQGGIR
jgi:hypothetical protein